MKRRISIIYFAFFMLLCSCKADESMTLLSVNAYECCKLCDYQDMESDIDVPEISIADLNSAILIHLSYNSVYKEVDGKNTLDNNDMAYIMLRIVYDDECYVDCTDYYLVGSKEISQEFDDCLLGMVVNENKVVETTLSDDYGDYQLAGKNCSVTVTLLGIFQFIEIDDTNEIMAYYGCSTMEEVYDKVRTQVEEGSIVNQAQEYVLDNTIVNQFPAYVETYINDYYIYPMEQDAESNGMDISSYCLAVTGLEFSEYISSVRASFAEYLVMKAVTEQAGKRFDESDYAAYTSKLAEKNNVSDAEVIEYFGEFELCRMMISEEAGQILLDYYENKA